MHPAYSQTVARTVQRISTLHRITQRPHCFPILGLGACLLLAVAAVPGAHAQSTAPAQGTTPAAKPADKEVQKLSEFVVTAEKPYTDRNVDIPRTVNDVQAYNIITKEDIESANPIDMNSYLKEDLLQSSANSENAQVQPQAGSVDGTRFSEANLRGMGSTGTLVLINGRRAAPTVRGATVGQADLNTIPMSAVEKIVVLSGSASAIYGGEAAGGVINVILKKNYQGGELSVSYGNPFKGYSPARTVDLTYGLSLGSKTHVLFTGNYNDRIPLHVRDRAYIKEYERQSMLNAPNGAFSATASRWNATAPFPGDTPNISLNPATVNGYVNPSTSSLVLKNGTSLNSTRTFVAKGASPGQNLSGLLANAGQINFNLPNTIYRGGLAAPLGAHPLSRSYRVAIDQEVTSRFSAFLEAGYSLSGSDNYSDPFTATAFAVPGNSPVNPFQQNVFVNFPRKIAVPNYSASKAYNVSTGFVTNLGREWRGVGTYTWSQSIFDQVGSIADTTTLTNLLNSGAVNPFVDTLAFPVALPLGLRDYSGDTTINTVDMHASGPVPFFFSLKPKLTLGFEHRKEGRANNLTSRRWDVDTARDDDVINFGVARTTDSLFGETTTQLVGPEKSIPLLHAFDVQLALRKERVVDGIGTNSGTFFPHDSSRAPTFSGPVGYHVETKRNQSTDMIGFKYQPFRSLIFRGSLAGALVTPSLSQLTGGSAPSTQTIDDVTLGRSYVVDRQTGGNPKLKSTNSTTRTAGLIWQPSVGFLKGFRFDFERWDIEQKDVVATLTAQSMLDAEGTPVAAGRIIRDPNTKMVTFIDLSAVNFAKNVSSGYDVSGEYRWKNTAIGSFQVKAAMVRTLTFDKSNNQGQVLSYLGFVNQGAIPIKYKANGSVNWRKQAWTATWSTNYYGPYKENGAPGDPVGANDAYTAIGRTNVRSQIVHRISGSYTFGRKTEGLRVMSDMTVTAGINNLFDAQPAYDTFFSTFISSTFVPKYGREWWVRIKKPF